VASVALALCALHHALFDLGVLGITEDRLLASIPLDAVLDEGRESPEE
jgi:predicted restriction endonuclease